ncbi:MAG TPA: hypothetical protein VK774_09820, partial [Solirubrobacteraceae bacterium]|nr:hypothetical protein [Solirubrobacteraceae bacterium]
MSSGRATLVTRRLLPLAALIHFYRRRLRAHGVQELLAGVGIAAAVALVLAAGVAQSSVTGSTRKIVRTVIGPADLQLRARGPEGFPEAMLGRVEHLRGVSRTAPLLERSLRVIGPHGDSATVYLAGADASLGVLDGLGSTLPLNALAAGTISLGKSLAGTLGVSALGGKQSRVTLVLGGVRRVVHVSALLDTGAVGALAGAPVAVMDLSSMQRLLGQPARVSRILIQTSAGARASVERELRALAGPRL